MLWCASLIPLSTETLISPAVRSVTAGGIELSPSLGIALAKDVVFCKVMHHQPQCHPPRDNLLPVVEC